MSGGSMDYLYERVEEAADKFSLSSPKRKALRTHLLKLAKALRAVEWNDSGDGDDEEEALLDAVLSKAAILDAAVASAQEALRDLNAALALTREST